jgi:hypothetical protein
MSLYVVAKLLGKERALETAQYMEYDWNQQFSVKIQRDSSVARAPSE